jgi:segregation and condensation protein B
MKEKDIKKEILAVLFYKNDEVSVPELSKLLDVDRADIRRALEHIEQSLEDVGLVLIVNNDKYSLATAPELSDLVERMTKEDLNKDLSPASLETLSIIAYKGLVTKKEIEYIRGVNSSFSIRALLMRGLIERESSMLDERIFLYKPSTDVLRHLGITSLSSLPEWKSIQAEIHKIQEISTDSETDTETHE